MGNNCSNLLDPEKEEARLLKAGRDGFLYFNRCHEEEWSDINSFYAYDYDVEEVSDNYNEEEEFEN